MKAVILCGGMGTRLREETEYRPKPMVEIGTKPILWHIMKMYSHYGIRDFILCLGYKGDVIKDFFYHYKTRNNDFTIDLATGDMEIHEKNNRNEWKITLADTGLNTLTGARIKKIERYIEEDTFMVTYGDGVADVNIEDLLKFHNKHGKIGTVTGVYPPSRYGEMKTENDRVISFAEKPQSYTRPINGGFFVFQKEFFDYLPDDDSSILEREPLENLTRDGQLNIYNHKGFWHCMDTYRDYLHLNEIWKMEKPPWRVWK